ncbi:hypothetical protein FCL54_10665 [Pseudalkalibacillus caeni]|uniref:Uncharacterized protein n=2 Tax=Exobacillus caeni TaxID=2574798 RepID=A0A5R9FDA9_9BACL|nr:hypothetical protein FCL54_10665 [Pseudalkalibacillus caeni]
MGKHVVIIRCNPQNNRFLSMHSSYEAPLEPAVQNCAQTLSNLLSIGYKLKQAVAISHDDIQYILVKT